MRWEDFQVTDNSCPPHPPQRSLAQELKQDVEQVGGCAPAWKSRSTSNCWLAAGQQAVRLCRLWSRWARVSVEESQRMLLGTEQQALKLLCCRAAACRRGHPANPRLPATKLPYHD